MIGSNLFSVALLVGCTLSLIKGNDALKGQITSFQLFREDKDTKIVDLTNGAVINIKDIPGLTTPSFNINAVTNNGTVRSVRFWYNNTNYRLEEALPFAFCGNNGPDYFKCTKLGCGTHTISAVPYSRRRAQGTAGSIATVSFSILCLPPPIPLKITGLGLINADNDSKLLDLTSDKNVTIVLTNILGMPTPSFNINASFTGSVRSVVFLYNNSKYSIEEGSPFAFCGNSGSNFFQCNALKCGTHTITAIPYPQGSGQGAAGTPFTATFTIVCPIKPPSTNMPSSRPSSAPSRSPTPRLVGLITGFQLYNADTDAKITDLMNGTVVSLKTIPGMVSPSFNINAATTGLVRSVRFAYNLAPFRVEDVAPFAFCGNNRTDFFKCRELACGNHTVSAVPYSLGFAQGVVGLPISVSFSIVC